MEDQDVSPPAPNGGGRLGLPGSAWPKMAAAVAVAIAAILLFPRSGGDRPPVGSLALIGTLVAAATTIALHAIVRRDLRLGSRVAASMGLAFASIAAVKFILAPLGLYEVNAVRPLEDVFGTVADPAGATVTAAVVFGLYALVYALLYRIWHRRAPGRTRRSRQRAVVLFLIAIPLVVLTGIGIFLFVILGAPRQYLEFVFTSGVAVLVGLALLVAATLIGSTFRRLAASQDLIADVGVIVSLFWLGLAFLALYHVLWIVYVLVLGSIWPLRTVVPK